MCEMCNKTALTPDQLKAVSGLTKDTQNYGMLLRHLANGGHATTTTKKAVRNAITHEVIPAGTTVILTRPPQGRDTYHSGGCFYGKLTNSQLGQVFFGDSLYLFHVEYSELTKE